MTGGELDVGTLLWTGAASLLISVLMLRWGLWPRRRGEEPYCRRCHYNLTGLTSDRCPECGTHISTETTVHGRRQRRPLITVIALFLAALAAMCFVQSGRQYDWYRTWPFAWVKAGLGSANAQTAQRAWEELVRRERVERLSSRHQAELIELYLAEQVAPAPTHLLLSSMMNYLGERFLEDELSDENKTAFFEQIITLDLQVRPRIVVGDRLPYAMPWSGNRGPGGSFWLHLDDCPLLIDGRPTGRIARRGKSEKTWGGVGGMSKYGRPCDLAPGQHTLSTIAEVRYYHGRFKDVDQSRLCHVQTLHLEAKFEVLETEPDDFMKPVDDPSLKENLLISVRPQDLALAGDPKTFTWTIAMTGLPMNVAFDVYVRVGTREQHLGVVSGRPERGTHYHSSENSWNHEPVDTVDVILRSSEEMARKTIDIYEFWEGELVHEDVPVEIK